MTTTTKLSAYGAALLAAFAVAFGLGSALGPVGVAPAPAPAAEHPTGEAHP